MNTQTLTTDSRTRLRAAWADADLPEGSLLVREAARVQPAQKAGVARDHPFERA